MMQGNVLVATTVIENGVDMPNVNTIVVLEAQRFGMSTLYQLRGRVGRAQVQAYALFLTNATCGITFEAENRLSYLQVQYFPHPALPLHLSFSQGGMLFKTDRL